MCISLFFHQLLYERGGRFFQVITNRIFPSKFVFKSTFVKYAQLMQNCRRKCFYVFFSFSQYFKKNRKIET